MKYRRIIIALLCFTLMSANIGFTCQLDSYFSPQENIEQVIISELLQAKKSVKLALFGITDNQLTETLIKLHNCGIQVELTVDKRMSRVRGSDVKELKKAGIPVYIKKTSALNHNKFAIIDEKVVIMGSYNWSDSAAKQDNSIVVINNCKHTTKKFLETFEFIKQRDSQ